MLLHINVKNCQTCHLLSTGVVLIVLSLWGSHVIGYIFSVIVNSSSIIGIDDKIQRSSWVPKRPKSITQGWLVLISCLFNTNKTVKTQRIRYLSKFKVVLHVLHEKSQQQLVPD